MEEIYQILLIVMPILAVIVFVSLFFVKAGYGMFRTRGWGVSVPNKLGWVMMEFPAVLVMAYLWATSKTRFDAAPLCFFLLFELHYVQRTFVFPFLMRGKGRMPIAVMMMGVVFNLINGFMLGEGLFHLAHEGYYSEAWLTSLAFVIGVLIFLIGFGINLHSDNVIRNLRPKGDTRHYLPGRGMYRFVTSGNYFGELTEWVGFAILTQSAAAWIFALWTFSNLAPRAYAIRKRYCQEFGAEAVGSRKCLVPFIW